jgi:predicted nuclease of predicted toxin-antitoxin system
MRLLVDAPLPLFLVPLLFELGHDVVHTSERPNGNRTPDREITRIAEVQDRIVVTKDRDLVDGHSDALADAFDDVDFVELDRRVLILHG